MYAMMFCGSGSGSGNDRKKRSADERKADEDDAAASTVCSISDVASEGGADCSTSSDFSIVNNETASCLSRELKQLPMRTREKVGQDLYGLSEGDTIEPSDFDSLREEIDKIEAKQAYERAYEMDPEYVSNTAFQLMFLRATQGKAKAAAKRMVRHFDTKLHLFGEEKLVKDIQISDLDEDDMEALESGGFQVLPERDLAGRSVLFGRYTCMRYRSIENMLRALWYIWMVILEDEINQIKGVVAIGHEIGRGPLERFDGLEDTHFEMFSADGGFDRDLARQVIKIPLSVPVRPVGYHLCTDSEQWVGILNMIMATLCKFIRLRMRIHHGTDQECKYMLMTHGLPAGSLPVDKHGEVDLTPHMHWLEHRKRLEMFIEGDHSLEP
mmetsp:Transcript_40007/g.61477  ORF Transcript_40007/g.61477 Transcript_40007/m.61477 type:complete len:383 (-) Transcript_40007:315-1463(-)|eukprot:CAMPEP_0117043818 /NCGR_PEP_ID=MMETSP0472-20121206/30425_1 /TAXON_ID=693140 ORGANISM="Tiarina fusus, Strain LIS" /NCGR_SAMPLE_ID=MMETSP0472 /ASSEMBLY_ACC=CAM_ASM_000603 /LENGTH=382 /DNA_ID=CAMNT_0004755421 /DNA_START=350 /DNA_END=1498 /DNA_ORIENTATION=-